MGKWQRASNSVLWEASQEAPGCRYDGRDVVRARWRVHAHDVRKRKQSDIF